MSMEHALAFDPGPSTGIVRAHWPEPMVDAFRELQWSACTVRESLLWGWLQERGTRLVMEYAQRKEPCRVLVERPPQAAASPAGAARLIQEWLGEVGCLVTVRVISPGEWKPWAKAHPLHRGITKSQHERDALGMFKWWLETKR